jgi:hypothetical protein
MRTFLTVRETAFLLQRPEMAVRRMIDAGQLCCLGDWKTTDGRRRQRLSPDSVRERFPTDGSYQLRRLAIGAILAGRLKVPAPESRWGPPAPLELIADALCTNAFLPRITSPSATTDRTAASISHKNH